jgi:hypothetical protein
MGRAARTWQLRRCIFSMECRDALERGQQGKTSAVALQAR